MPTAAKRTKSRVAESPWVTPKEAAEYLKVGVDRIYAACAGRGLKHVKLGRQTIRLQFAWLDAWAEELVRHEPAAIAFERRQLEQRERHGNVRRSSLLRSPRTSEPWNAPEGTKGRVSK